jgi:Dihaem cytochrome c
VLLGGLADHFGEDATVDPATRGALQAYAAANAADVAPYRLSASLARASAGQTPLRILDIGGLRHEHEEVPRAWVVDNPEVRSLSNCAACHPAAPDGRFDEGSIRIPGHGPFED